MVLTACAALHLLFPASASAKQNGILTSGCNACHGGSRNTSVSISVEPAQIELGGSATVTVRIGASDKAGFYLYSYGKGTFKELAGQGARLATPTDVIHASPKNASGGQVTFQVGWTAPTAKGPVTFEVLAVAANGDGTPNGDSTGQGRLSVAVGCVGVERWADTDGDGFGNMNLPKDQVCPDTPGYSDKPGDCNDYLSYVYPGAPEKCNKTDDDCDGQLDEGLESAVVYRDADGDGYGDRFTMDMRVGCAMGGYAPNREDCDDDDKDVHPGVKEVCNNKDDDCNGRIDEGAKATCGTGWCRRNADACDARMCTPGPPRAEQCNLFDDDCDGVIDNNAKCDDPTKVCFEGRCLASDDAKAAAEAKGVADGGAGVSGAPDGGAPPSVGGGNPATGGGTPVKGDPTARPSSLWGCRYGGTGGAAGPLALAAVAAFLIRRRRRR
jgi:MYXO-CTERM domain-containing protein